MRISIITPSAAHARTGNRNTAARWARLLRDIGHRVSVEQSWSGGSVDVMIALHARRSHDSIRRFADRHPERPLVVALTGTDIYRDILTDAEARLSLELATRLIVLQDRAPRALERRLRPKVRVVYQSTRTTKRAPRLQSAFEVVVSGHLREEKDPFRTAAALRHLAPESRVRVTHVGAAMSPDMARQARDWMARESRYRWLGEVPHGRALRLLSRARLMVISSLMEGGANVVSEALALGVPVLASRIAGNVGMLGATHPGYFPVGNERILARLLGRAESQPLYYRRLAHSCASRAALVSPQRERAALEALLREITDGERSSGSRARVGRGLRGAR